MGKAGRGDRKNAEHLSRAFDAKILKKSSALARRYSLVIEPESELGYVGRTLEMPMVMSDGASVEACVRAVLQATSATIATMLELGEEPPVPAAERTRDQQLNIRVSAHERLRLEALAREGGFVSVSDYVRSAALRSVG